MRRVVRFLCLLILMVGTCACRGEHVSKTEPDTQEIIRTTASVEGPSFSAPIDEGTDTNASTAGAAETTEEPTTQEPSTEAPRKLIVSYVGPQRYEMDRVAIGDFQIRVMQGEDILEENPQGWSSDLSPLLKAGENTYHIAYEDMACEVTVTALSGMADGNTLCRPGEASTKKLSGHKALVSALTYLSKAYDPEKNDPFTIMALGDRELTQKDRSALFVREIFGKYDIRLPYETEEMETYGTEVPREQVKVGDLVCFTDMQAEDDREQRLLGIYVGGDFVLSLNADSKADFYWMHDTTCRRLFDNTCDLSGEESFVYVVDAFKKQKIYGEWVTSYVDDVPYMIGRIRNFFFTIDLSSCVDGLYPTYFCYDTFFLPEEFVEQWKQQYLKKNALCEVMKNGEYIRFDAAGQYHFKVDCDRATWKSLTPGVYGEYWNMDWSFLRE
ncbi:MAG: C40 family peptidase [Lachnospiraceae bacterium]|nr:C40 family peptidase [Lachnospiraceae bacterium]